MYILGLILIFGLFLFAKQADAQVADSFRNFQKAASESGYDTSLGTGTLSAYIGVIIGQLLIFLGSVAIVIIVYAGYLWMTAGDNSEQIKKAKQWLINGVIGLVIISTAYAITSFVVGAVGPQSTFIQLFV